MDDPKSADQYLGCTHKIVNHTLPDGTEITRVEWDMENFLAQCIDSYKELAGVDTLEKVEVPFIAEDDYGNISRRPASWGRRPNLSLVRGRVSVTALCEMEARERGGGGGVVK